MENLDEKVEKFGVIEILKSYQLNYFLGEDKGVGRQGGQTYTVDKTGRN